MKGSILGIGALVVLALVASAGAEGIAASGPAASGPPASPAVLLEKGIYTEQTFGDLDAAIGIYQQIVHDAKANRPYVAQAQFRLGACYLKKGQKDQAVEQFRDVVKTYPDQKTVVSLASAELDKLAGMVKRKINKKVADFPTATDLSTPESAAAAWQRASSVKDADAISELSLVHLDADEQRQWYGTQEKRDPEGLAIYCKALSDSEIVEVLVYKDDMAEVITFLPFPEGKGRSPYSARGFGRVNGQWKNLGEDRLASLEEAEQTFSRKKDSLWENFQSTMNPREGKSKATRVGAKTSGSADQEALKGKLISWVEKFFSENFRDITARKTLEWGEVETTPAGNLAIRYKYLATIWDKDKIVINQRFTFTPEGKYVSHETVENGPADAAKTKTAASAASSHPASYSLAGIEKRKINKKVADFPAKRDLSTPEAACAAWNRAWAAQDADAVCELGLVYSDPEELREYFAKTVKDDPAGLRFKPYRDSEIVEVLVYKADLAEVISRLSLPEGKGQNPYSARSFGRVDGQWKNLGEDRESSVEAAEAKLAQGKDAAWDHFQSDVNESKDIAAAEAAIKPVAADKEAAKAKLISWVEDFFAHNYRDITHRETLEWGEPGITPEGNLSMRYKYLAAIWDKYKIVAIERFTFTPEGKYVSVKTIEKKRVAASAPAPEKK